jgi:hypothetical protein
MIWLPPPPISKLDRRHTGRLRKRDNLLTWGGGGRGAKLYECEKALFFKSFNILCMRHMPRIKPETLERCAIFIYATAHKHKPDFILPLKFSKLVNSKVEHVYVLVQYRKYTRTVHPYKHGPSSSVAHIQSSLC